LNAFDGDASLKITHAILILLFLVPGVAVAHLATSDNVRGKQWTLVFAPALFYSLLVLLILQVTGPIVFQFFTQTKSINNSFSVSLLIAIVWFVAEVAGNIRNVKEKEAEIISYGSRRSGESAKEGFTPIPGIFPLLMQVFLYAIFRFSVFGDARRKISTSPVLFNETILAYSSDNKAFLLVVGCKFDIADPYLFDDALDDTKQGEDAKRAPLIERVKEAVAHSLGMRLARYPMQNLRERLPSWNDFPIEGDLRSEAGHYGLSPAHITIRFLRFDDARLQEVFQSRAGADIRRGDVYEKGREIRALFESLKTLDSSYTLADAERMWETMTKQKRGSFRFSFL
jgi:hypothetical protein